MSKITSVRRVANNGLQAEMQDIVSHPGRVNVLAALNKGDSRFQTGNPRRAWFPVTIASLAEQGVSSETLSKIEELEYKVKMDLNIENPQVNGKVLRIQVNESVTPDEFQVANVMKTAKQIMITDKVAANKGINTKYDLSQYIGQNGYFVESTTGQHIFSATSVTLEDQVRSVFVEGELVPEKELADFGATLAEPVKKEEFANA